MTDIVGVIPAAGRSIRWGGYPKFMLPTGNGTWAMDRAVAALLAGGAQRIVVVTRRPWLDIIADHLLDDRVALVEERGDRPDMWGAIWEALPWCGDMTLMAMSDTLFPVDAFTKRPPDQDLTLGCFYTQEPGRYGVLLPGRLDGFGAPPRLADKERGLHGRHVAWGVVCWPAPITAAWMATEGPDSRFADVLNKIIQAREVNCWDIGQYLDFASWADYRFWIESGAQMP